jgi:hypothetical protein
LTVKSDILLSNEPLVSGDAIFFTRMARQGYEIGRLVQHVNTGFNLGMDTFHPAVGSSAGEVWAELASARSDVVRFVPQSRPLIMSTEEQNAEEPSLSRDGKWLVFIREEKGKGSLLIKNLKLTEPAAAISSASEVADSNYDVLEATFLSDDRVIFSAEPGGRPMLFTADTVNRGIAPQPFILDARYPAVSPDGVWLAYSEEERGSWQVSTLKLSTGEKRRLTNSDCNSVMPTWRDDSKKLIYATDCGRGLGLTALAELQVVR